MKAVIQKVNNAKVAVNNKIVGQIGEGLLVFLAIHKDDTEDMIAKMADKIINLRIFIDSEEKMNLSLKDKKAEILLVSQFTLYGDTKKGNRPSFIESAPPEKAEAYYEKLKEILIQKDIKTETGKFRKKMEVSLINDGPTTIIINL